MFSLSLLDHTDRIQPNRKISVFYFFLFFFLGMSLCVCVCFQIFPRLLCTHYESSWVENQQLEQHVEVLSVSDSLACHHMNHMTNPIWIAQGHSFLRSDLAIQISTQCCNSFSSDSWRACQSRAGIIQRAPVQKIMLYRQNVKIWNGLLDFYHG